MGKKINFLLIVIFISTIVFVAGPINAQEEKVLVLSSTSPKEGPIEVYTDYFVDAVSRKSNGKIQFEEFFDALLGGDKAQLELLKVGEIDMSIVYVHASQWFPEYDATRVPFLFPNPESIRNYYNDPSIMEIIEEKMITNGNCVMIDPLVARGRRYTTANKPLVNPEDFNGLKIRLPEIPIWIEVWKALGAIPIPISSSETFSALQTGVVDSHENLLGNIEGRHMYEVQDYLIATEHLEMTSHLIMNKDSFESLSPEYQKIIIESAREASEYNLKLLDENNQKVIDNLIHQGMELVKPDIEKIKNAVMKDIEIIAEQELAPGVLEAAEKAIKQTQLQ
jgi:tripartite ATP-independent transporter DctP family solute receptor